MKLPSIGASPVLAHLYFTGNLRDYSGCGNYGTGKAGCRWTRGDDRHQVRVAGTGWVITPETASLTTATGTIFIAGDFRQSRDNGHFIAQGDVGGTGYIFYRKTATTLRGSTSGGWTQCAVTCDVAGSKSLAMTFADAQPVGFYRDGLWLGAGGVLASAGTAAPLYVGNHHHAAVPVNVGFSAAFVYPQVLSAVQIAVVHNWVMDQRSTVYAPTRFYSIPKDGQHAAVSWSGKQALGRLVDSRGTAHLFPYGVQFDQGIIDRAFRLSGGEWADYAPSPVSAYPCSLAAWMKTTSAAVSMAVLAITDSGSDVRTVSLSLTGTGKPTARVVNTAAVAAQSAVAVNDGLWHHLVAVFESADSRKIYVNGQQMAADVNTLAFPPVDSVDVGRWGAATPVDYFDGLIEAPTIFDRALTAAEVLQEYLVGAGQEFVREDFETARESLVNTGGTVGECIGDTCWRDMDGVGAYRVVSAPTIGYGHEDELLADADVEAAGVADWTAVNSVLTKETVDPYQGVRSMTITHDGGAGTYFMARQPLLPTGEYYIAAVQVRSDGLRAPILRNHDTDVRTGDLTTSWNRLTALFYSMDVDVCAGAVGNSGQVEVDDLHVRRARRTGKVLRTETTGCLYQPTSTFSRGDHQAAYGTWEVKHLGADTKVSFWWNFISDRRADTFNSLGYALVLGQVNVQLVRTDAGWPAVALATFDGPPVYLGRWNTIRVTRSPAGQFHVYLNGQLGTAIAGANPVVDVTYTNAKYWTTASRGYIAGVSAGDHIAHFRYMPAVVTPGERE